MSIFDELDNVNPEQDARDAEAGRELLPVGVYAVKVSNVLNKDAGAEIHFEVVDGPFKGRKFRDTVRTHSDKEAGKQRARIIAVRLGVLGKSGEGTDARYCRIPGKNGFGDAAGAYAVADVVHRVHQDDEKKPKGEQRIYANLSFVGLLDPADKKSGSAGEFVMKMRAAAASGQPAHAATAPAASDRFASL